MTTDTLQAYGPQPAPPPTTPNPKPAAESLGMIGWLLPVAVLGGDFLLWDIEPQLSFVLFLASLCGLQVLNSWKRQTTRSLVAGSAVLALALLPALETLNPLTVLIALFGSFASALTFARRWPETWAERVEQYVISGVLGGFQFPIAMLGLAKSGSTDGIKGKLLRWVGPLVFALIFVGLFAVANPIFEGVLAAIDIERLLSILFSERALLWGALAWFSFPFIKRAAPFRQWRKNREAAALIGPAKTLEIDFATRTLLLVNGVFLLQTLLDLAYLWGGVGLPDGMSYAEYSHRGAYPLVAASLLAGAFVLIAMRPGGAGEQSPLVKRLVLLWVAQNLMLLASSVMRLVLYINVYSLTYWRVAAMIWMALVAVGLVLIVARFLSGKSSAWLLQANAVALAVALYGCAVANFPSVIATYNLEHQNENAAGLDLNYLRSLGPYAVPAIDRYLDSDPILLPGVRRDTEHVKAQMKTAAIRWPDMTWRRWTFRRQRLEWFIESKRNAIAISKPGRDSHEQDNFDRRR